MGKGWGKRSKGRSGNKEQRDAADNRAAAEELAELARKRKRGDGINGSSPKRQKHIPQKLGCGGPREKLNVDELDSPSRAQCSLMLTASRCSMRWAIV